MISTVDKLLLNSDQQAELAEYTRAYNAAQAAGDQAGMTLAHQRAEALRASAGYSGGDAGDRYMLLTNAQNAPDGYTGYQKLVNDIATGGMNAIAAGYQQQMAQLDQQRAKMESQGAQNQASARSAAWNTQRLAADGLLTRGLENTGIADVITATALNQAAANAYRALLDQQQDLQENDAARLGTRADAMEDAALLQSELGTLLADAYQSFYDKDADRKQEQLLRQWGINADLALQDLKNQSAEKLQGLESQLAEKLQDMKNQSAEKQQGMKNYAAQQQQEQDYYYTLALQELKRQWELEDREADK